MAKFVWLHFWREGQINDGWISRIIFDLYIQFQYSFMICKFKINPRSRVTYSFKKYSVTRFPSDKISYGWGDEPFCESSWYLLPNVNWIPRCHTNSCQFRSSWFLQWNNIMNHLLKWHITSIYSPSNIYIVPVVRGISSIGSLSKLSSPFDEPLATQPLARVIISKLHYSYQICGSLKSINKFSKYFKIF